MFRWTSAEGARSYELQVSQDQSFATLIDDVKTDSSGNETKGAGCTVYLTESRDGAATWSTPIAMPARDKFVPDTRGKKK